MADPSGRKYYLIAGERSGDLHGSNLIKALKSLDPQACFRGWGGDMMENEGMDLVTHYSDMAFMGIWEVLMNLKTIKRFLKECKSDLLDYDPDVLILIDYPGFNLRMARFAHLHGIQVYYYISPKIWAWNTKRAIKIKKNVDRMFVILPFEEEFYKTFDYDVDYVGNPLADAHHQFFPDPEFIKDQQLDSRPIVAILPGSRKQEISNMLNLMVKIADSFPAYQFVVAGINNMDPYFYSQAESSENVKVIYDQTYDLLHHSHAAIVTSGTATLETALFNVPQVVVYKLNALSYAIGKLVVKVPYISLVNLIAGKEVVKELIQRDYNLKSLKKELGMILVGERREYVLDEYREIQQLLKKSSPSEQTASLMIQYLNA